MNQGKREPALDSHEMREEYDFSRGVRGKYARRYAEGTNVALIAPDVAEAFPDSRAVNEALRTLLRLDAARTRTPRGTGCAG